MIIFLPLNFFAHLTLDTAESCQELFTALLHKPKSEFKPEKSYENIKENDAETDNCYENIAKRFHTLNPQSVAGE